MKFQFDLARLASIGAALLMACTVPIGCSGTADDSTASIGQTAVGAIAITGTVFDANGHGLPGVTVRLTGSAQATTTTGPGGTYTLNVPHAGSYSVQPSLSGCTFVPSVVNLNGLTASTVVNFDGSGTTCGGPSQNSGATSGMFSISGVVKDTAGNPVSGIKVFLNGSTQAVRTTTATGSYTFQVNQGSYSLNPSGPCAFTPGVVNLNNLHANTTQNFVAGSGCTGTRPDAGAPDAAPDTSRPDASPDVAVDTGKPDVVVDTGAPDTICIPKTMCTGGQNCGTQSNGCSGTINCGSCTAPQTCGGGGTANVCGCTPTKTTCTGAQQCGTQDNGCGVAISCGTCPTGSNCDATGQCTTVCPTTCSAGNVCGTQTFPGCPPVNCGTCTPPQTCDNANHCVCIPKPTCTGGQNCGTQDNGCGGTVNCGTCTAPQTCGGGGTANVCGCTPTKTTCTGGQQCGTQDNGCGIAITCGTCPTGSNCDATGQCVSTCPTTCSTGNVCGTQTFPGCPPVNCGTCTPPLTCDNANHCVCVPKTACTGGQTCGMQDNGCGGTITCGTCTAPQTCGGGGTPNVCGCTPKTACTGGQNCGTQDNTCGGTVNCGTCTAPQTCGGGGTAGMCGGGTVNACAAFNAGAACTPTEQRFVNKSAACYECMANAGCLDDALFGDTGHECADVAGTATAGGGTGTSRNQLCLDALDCILNPVNLCAASDVTICYCGTLGAGNGCATAPAGAPNGKCLTQELNGLEHTVDQAPSVVLPDYTALNRGAGMANQLFNCAKSNGCDTLCSQ